MPGSWRGSRGHAALNLHGGGAHTFEAVAHLSLTVTDPDRSAEFYHRVLGTETVMSTVDDVGPVTLVASPSLMIGLRRHTGTAQKDTFDPTRIWLDHVAFQVASRDELEAWRGDLVTQGVTVSEIVESPFGLHLNLTDPDTLHWSCSCPAKRDGAATMSRCRTRHSHHLGQRS